jgi:RNA polymerase-interacting CarD/CdnL/TRCF family regulator
MSLELTIGQNIVHRRYGAGTVVGVREGNEDEGHARYYIVDIPSKDLKLHLPADSEEAVPLREIASARKIQRALKMLAEAPVDLPSDYRKRRALVSELMTDGTVRSLARIIRDLCARQREKSMSTLEATMLTDAKRQLAGEVALAEGIELTQAMQRIETALCTAEPI